MTAADRGFAIPSSTNFTAKAMSMRMRVGTNSTPATGHPINAAKFISLNQKIKNFPPRRAHTDKAIGNKDKRKSAPNIKYTSEALSIEINLQEALRKITNNWVTNEDGQVTPVPDAFSKLKAYREAFDAIIHADGSFGGLLETIKEAYEELYVTKYEESFRQLQTRLVQLELRLQDSKDQNSLLEARLKSQQLQTQNLIHQLQNRTEQLNHFAKSDSARFGVRAVDRTVGDISAQVEQIMKHAQEIAKKDAYAQWLAEQEDPNYDLNKQSKDPTQLLAQQYSKSIYGTLLESLEKHEKESKTVRRLNRRYSKLHKKTETLKTILRALLRDAPQQLHAFLSTQRAWLYLQDEGTLLRDYSDEDQGSADDEDSSEDDDIPLHEYSPIVGDASKGFHTSQTYSSSGISQNRSLVDRSTSPVQHSQRTLGDIISDMSSPTTENVEDENDLFPSLPAHTPKNNTSFNGTMSPKRGSVSAIQPHRTQVAMAHLPKRKRRMITRLQVDTQAGSGTSNTARSTSVHLVQQSSSTIKEKDGEDHNQQTVTVNAQPSSITTDEITGAILEDIEVEGSVGTTKATTGSDAPSLMTLFDSVQQPHVGVDLDWNSSTENNTYNPAETSLLSNPHLEPRSHGVSFA